jgi:quinohemoprotein amine dehydrogenase
MIRVSSPFDIVRLILTTSARQSRTNMTRVNGKRMTSRLPRKAALTLACASLAGVTLAQQAEREEGIPVNDPLVIAKCGSCHTRDERGNMQRISWERTTPEGWQEALRQMILADGVQLTPPEARAIVNYLSASHGLAPEEAKLVAYAAERRIHDESNVPDESLSKACTRCHAFARVLVWRRSAGDWRQLVVQHNAQHQVPVDEGVIAALAKYSPLHTPEWAAWSAQARTLKLEGRWLLTAHLPGRGRYYGEMQIVATGKDEFTTSAKLTSVQDGSTLTRAGRSVVFGGYAWRGRSKGESAASAPDDLSSESREALWIAPDQSTMEGRWFWGDYQEFGFDLKLRRAAAAGATLMSVVPASLKSGSQGNRIRLIGDLIPAQVKPADLRLGPGVTVRRILSHNQSEVVAEVDVAADAALGSRSAGIGQSVISGAFAIYDRVDYIKVSPNESMAAFGDPQHGRGYMQFEAIGYQRGADGQVRTADDVELGPVDVTWSLERMYVAEGSGSDQVGKVGPSGLFTPSDVNPNVNFDMWAIATAKNEKDKNGKPLVGKSYMVVTVPTYVFNGRKFVRDLDRWVDDGPAK